MNFKKIISAFTAISVAAGASALNVNAAADNGFTEAEIYNSEVRPYIQLTKQVISIDEVYSHEVTATVSITGADYSYASTGLHIYYDPRLEIGTDSRGRINVKKGEAASDLILNVSYDNTADDYGMEGIFISTIGDYNEGSDGILAEITFTLPDNAEEGDVYPLDIVYRANPKARDLFTNVNDNMSGKLMQAWTFTNGIYNPEYNNNFYASYDDIEKCEALRYIDSSYDGYIAIADSIPVTTTTTARTTTMTTTKTTTTKAVTTTTKPSGISIIPESVTMNIGDTNRLALIGAANPEDIIWTSGNTAVASVDSKGNVTAKKAGKAEIFAIYNNKSVSCIVTVVSGNITGITLSGDANCDDELSVADATLVLQYCGNKDKYEISEQGLLNADVDGTLGISAMDALVIQQIDAGIYDIGDKPTLAGSR